MPTMKKIQLFHIAFILLLISGCADDLGEMLNDSPINKDGSIAFRTDSILTRGTPRDDLSAYDKVNLIAYSHTGNYADGKSFYRQTVLNKGGSSTNPTWDYSPHMFWPEGRQLSFLAYSSDVGYATASGQDGVFVSGDASAGIVPTIEYIVPQDVKKQPDLLVTALLNHQKVNNVTLSMKHALSCVSFCAVGLPEMKVKSITLKNVYQKATLSLDDESIRWTLDLTSKGLTALEPGIDPDKPLDQNPADNNYLMTADGYLMMIPQTLQDALIDIVYWKGTAGTEKTVTEILPTTVVWEPGKKYIYKFGEMSEIVVYYEKYEDGSYGFQSKSPNLAPLNEDKKIAEAGYGVLSKNGSVSAKPTLKIGSGNPIPAIKTPAISGEYSLYTVNQTATASNTFALPKTAVPVDVYFDGNSVSCGKIVPHFAKGVYDNTQTTHAIRTPQQMRNISGLTTASDAWNDNPSFGNSFSQERDLDFSVEAIGGGEVKDAVVDQVFIGTYTPLASKTISNVTIKGSSDVGLFSRNNGTINDIMLKSSSITGSTQVGGIVGENWFGGTISKPRVIGTASDPANSVTISGVSSVGGIVGANRGKVIGNTSIDVATGITVAEVSGWVTISGSNNSVGGIAGYNNATIVTVLVYGVFVTGTGQGNLTESKVTIKGGYYVGGVIGENWGEIKGNVTTGVGAKSMPDVAGVVEITGTTAIGGIVGVNGPDGKLSSVNIRSGRNTPTTIKGTGNDVGGIVGANNGTLGVDNTSTFISARGNIHITGFDNVGGIVGSNSGATELRNCFVFDFQNTTTGLGHYAPQIKSETNNVGGIVGTNGGAKIIGCSVFSTSDKTLTINALKMNPNNLYDNPGSNAGGIAGFNSNGSNTDACSVVGRVKVTATANSGGFFGGNTAGTTTTRCWIGSSDGNGLLAYAVKNFGLPITPPAGATTYGTPIITGEIYIGGVAGLNSGLIEEITLSDNIEIGRADNPLDVNKGSNFVGGIVGGNSLGNGSTDAVVRNCIIKNESGKIITIRGSRSLGGIAGLNNGLVIGCNVSGSQAAPLKIIGLGTIGGIIGQNGGHSLIGLKDPNDPNNLIYGTGNDYTAVRSCTVTGYVTIEGNLGGWGLATEVGGIIGLNGPTKDKLNNIDNCVVRGTGSITVSVGGTAGGIVGTNSGNINKSDIQNVIVESEGSYAGGIAGRTSANATTFAPPGSYRCDINDCRVYSGTTIKGTYSTNVGALIGYLDSTVDITLGNDATNRVNNSGVSVNGGQPTLNNGIVGFVTGDGVNVAKIQHTVEVVQARMPSKSKPLKKKYR